MLKNVPKIAMKFSAAAVALSLLGACKNNEIDCDKSINFSRVECQTRDR